MRHAFSALFATTLLAPLSAAGCNSILDNQASTSDLADGAIDGQVVDYSPTLGPDASVGPTPTPTVTRPTADAAPPSDGAAPPVNTGPHCTTSQKYCFGKCVALDDQAYGCAAAGCTACRVSGATATCAGGRCAVASCQRGYADCDGNPANGCETDLSTPSHCGGCNAKCGPSAPLCSPSGSGFTCATGCGPQAPTLCGAQCVDLSSTTHDCGGCGHACAQVEGASVQCQGSQCKFTCDQGLHACGNSCVSDVDPATCGRACTPCPTVANADTTCDPSGQCGFVCHAGFHDCGGVCVPNNSTATCGNACSPCGTSPNASATCDGRSCGFVCVAGFHDCGGSCVSNDDPATCGNSCIACQPAANGVATCDGKRCGSNCTTGFHMCGGGCVSDSATATCGNACTACPAPANAKPTCDGTACGFTCNPGFADCDKNPTNGCEVDLSGDPLNCGQCTHSCGMQGCTKGACDPPPPPPPADAGGG